MDLSLWELEDALPYEAVQEICRFVQSDNNIVNKWQEQLVQPGSIFDLSIEQCKNFLLDFGFDSRDGDKLEKLPLKELQCLVIFDTAWSLFMRKNSLD